jgi:protein-L-isoaspartate O-methyltransferase
MLDLDWGWAGLMVVLEIGCYSGYSALAWAEALKDVPQAEVTTTLQTLESLPFTSYLNALSPTQPPASPSFKYNI